MSTTAKIQALINSLTIEQAREYEAQTDKLAWIIDTLADPVDIPAGRGDRNLLMIEDALIGMLEAA